MESAYARSIMIFEEIFDLEDDILLIVDSPCLIEYLEYHKLDDDKTKHMLKSELEPFILNKAVANDVKFVKGEERCYCDDEEMTMFRATIECKVKDINYKKLLKSICNKEMGRKPRYEERVSFIHLNSQIKYYLYDDRGLDLHSLSKKSLVDIYYKYNSWILDYDRKRINKIFK